MLVRRPARRRGRHRWAGMYATKAVARSTERRLHEPLVQRLLGIRAKELPTRERSALRQLPQPSAREIGSSPAVPMNAMQALGESRQIAVALRQTERSLRR